MRTLPDDILVLLCALLPIVEVFRVACVSRSLQRITAPTRSIVLRSCSGLRQGPYRLDHVTLQSEAIRVSGIHPRLHFLWDIISTGVLSSTCRYLVLAQTGVTDDDMESFSGSLLGLCPQSPLATLRSLSFADNLIGFRGVASIAPHLAVGALSKVTTLNLRQNRICASGVDALVSAFSNRQSALTQLLLNENVVTDRGVVTLSRALPVAMPRLVLLNLRGNTLFTELGIGALADCIAGGSLFYGMLVLSPHKGLRPLRDACEASRVMLSLRFAP